MDASHEARDRQERRKGCLPSGTLRSGYPPLQLPALLLDPFAPALSSALLHTVPWTRNAYSPLHSSRRSGQGLAYLLRSKALPRCWSVNPRARGRDRPVLSLCPTPSLPLNQDLMAGPKADLQALPRMALAEQVCLNLV